MADRQYEDPDPRATIPIVSGSNFAQYAIGRGAPEPPVPAPTPVPARPRRRAVAILGWIVLALLIGAAAAWIAYSVTGSH
jgi:ferric-dicitrate binding protein FerR (iron transport regulator)